MLSIKQVKQILKDKNISDKDAEMIRDECRELAEIIFEKWQQDKKAGKTPCKQKNVRYDSGTFNSNNF